MILEVLNEVLHNEILHKIILTCFVVVVWTPVFYGIFHQNIGANEGGEIQPMSKDKLSNQEDITLLSELKFGYSCFDEKEEPYYRALSNAIQALRADGDLISRDALKKAVYVEFGNSNLTDAFIDIIDNAPTVKTFADKIHEITTPDGRTSLVAKNLTKEEEWLFFRLINHDLLTYSKYGGQVVPDMLQGWRYQEGDAGNEID
jgi:hypothetical protein